MTLLRNDETSPLFMAAIEATEEAIINSLFKAQTMEGKESHVANELPVEEVLKILRKYNVVK
jgi:D-aminopeptidase